MPTNTTKRIGAVALVAMLAAALVAATAPGAMARHGEDHPVVPGGQESNNCTAEFTLPFDSKQSESLSRPDDPVDTWVVDVGDRPGTVQLDVDRTSGDGMIAQLYEKDGSCNQVQDNETVGDPVEFDGLADNQKYWAHVELNKTTDTQADYTIIMEDD